MGSWVWNRIVPLLEEEGNEAFPVTLTGMGERVHLATKEVGMETAVQDVLNVIKYNDLDDFVVVGHSFAGKVAAVVADKRPDNVRSILYLDAARPAKVRTPQCAFDPSEFGPLPEGSWSIPLTQGTLSAIGKDVEGENLNWLKSKATPWPLKLMTDPIVLSVRFDAMKTSYIFCTGGGDPVDEVVNGKWGKLDGPYKIMDTGHWPMITKPEELAEDMMALAA